MATPFPYTLDNKRYHTLHYHFQTLFGQKVCKVPLCLATTCPNRDGTAGDGGCSFCSAEGGGGATVVAQKPLLNQFEDSVAPLWKKWPNAATIPYFQSYTNTYVPYLEFVAATQKALLLPKAVGLSIATRPDALPDDIVAYLGELAKKTFLTVELGLQTIHEETSLRINRGHNLEDFWNGFNKLTKAGVHVCIHIINGLPGETGEMMLDTVREIVKMNPHSIKIHMLHLVHHTALADEYTKAPFPLLTEEEYIAIVCDQLELLAPTTVVERVTGDPVAGALIAPLWTKKKLSVRNGIDKELARRNSWQGKCWQGKDFTESNIF